MKVTGRKRKAKIVSWNTFESPLSGRPVLSLGYKLRSGEIVFQYFASQYTPSLSNLLKATRVRVYQQSFNAARTVGKEVNVIIRKREDRNRVVVYAEVQPS